MKTLTLRDYTTHTEYQTKEHPLWWQIKGLSYTSSGYGSKIPTAIMVLDGTRWKRVYCRIYSNCGTTYFFRNKAKVIVY